MIAHVRLKLQKKKKRTARLDYLVRWPGFEPCDITCNLNEQDIVCSDFAPELRSMRNPCTCICMSQWRQNLGEPVLLMTDDVLAKCGSCTTISEALGKSKGSTQRPVEAISTFRATSIVIGHLKNSSISPWRIADRPQKDNVAGGGGESLPYLDLWRVKGRTNKFNATELFLSPSRHQWSLPSPIPPLLFPPRYPHPPMKPTLSCLPLKYRRWQKCCGAIMTWNQQAPLETTNPSRGWRGQ